MNFQMYKMEAVGLSKKQEFQKKKKKSTSASLTMPKHFTVWIKQIVENLPKELGKPDHLTCILQNLYEG